MIHDSRYLPIKILIILLTCLILISADFVMAVTCAPGDVLLNNRGEVVTDESTVTDAQRPLKCLYGSEVAANRGFGGTVTDARGTARIAINVAMGFLGVVVVFMVIYGGALWLTAAGREEQVTKGKHTLLWAALGAIVISIAWTITSYVLQIGQSIG